MNGKFRLMWRIGLALVLALSLSLVMAVPVAAAAGVLTAVSATPVNTTENAETTYTIGFTTADTPSTIKQVVMQFFTDLDVSSAVLGAVSGIGTGSVSLIEGQFVTYTVDSAIEVAASTPITIALSGIVNPVAGEYSSPVTVTTKDPTSTVIDQGTALASVTITPLPASFLVEQASGGVITTIAGAAFDVRVTAMDGPDGGGTKVDGYVGDVLISFTSTASDPKTIPFWELINFETGVGETSSTNFILTKVETGETITAEDTALEVTGTSAAITITPAALDSLTITGAPASVTAGVAFPTNITVTAYDAYGNVKTNGSQPTIAWTSTDESATPSTGLPANKTLALGTYTFLKAGFTLKTAGAQTITATEDGASISKTSDPITVNPAAASELTVAAAPATITANGSHSSTITATAYDEFDNVDTNYTASVTFTTSLGTLSGVSANFVSGVATATLTSTDAGTATIKVTSGTLADVTTPVTLNAPSKPVVWVSATGDDTTGDGTEALPYLTIAKGIEMVDLGGTVNVMPGTYVLGATLSIDKAGITIQSTHGAATTFIDDDGSISTPLVIISADAVTVEGFTIGDVPTSQHGIQIRGADAIVKDNIITAAGSVQIGIYIHAVGSMVTGNELNALCTMFVNTVSDCTLSGNTFGESLNLYHDVGSLIDGLTITGNTMIGSTAQAIDFGGGMTFRNILIEGNTISATTKTVGAIEIRDVAEVTDLRILGNDITDNTGPGISIASGAGWAADAGNVINNNNITGNDASNGLGIVNLTGVEVNAENNWWGTAVESAIAGMVSGDVDYSPWLTDRTYPIDLAAGWNLISLPLIPDVAAIETLLSGLDVNKVAAYSPFQDWKFYTPGVSSDLAQMNDGWGYWVDMNTAGALTVSGYEVCEPQAVPPDYDVAVGWNLIGFKSTAPTTGGPVEYLGPAIAGTDGTLEAIYGFSASTGLYSVPTEFTPGAGYWLAVNAAGTIYP